MDDCLTKLHRGAEGIDLECVVPYDDRLGQVRELEKRFDWVGFLDARDFSGAITFKFSRSFGVQTSLIRSSTCIT